MAANRNSPQKHVWRATMHSIDRRRSPRSRSGAAPPRARPACGASRFMAAGVDGLLRDKTRPSRVPPLPAEVVERVVALKRPARRSHPLDRGGDGRGPAGISVSSVQRSGTVTDCSRTGCASSTCTPTRNSQPMLHDIVGRYIVRRPMPSCCRSTRRAKSRRSTEPSCPPRGHVMTLADRPSRASSLP
jgi:hypothetical protein